MANSKLAKISLLVPAVDLILYGVSALLALTIGEIGSTQIVEMFGIVTFMALPLCFFVGIILSMIALLSRSTAAKTLAIVSLIANLALLIAYFVVLAIVITQLLPNL